MINRLKEYGISIDAFYSELPDLQKKYQSEIENLNQAYCQSNDMIVNTKNIVVFAQRDCMDSVVNINALKCIENHLSVEVSVILDQDIFQELFPNRRTPYIVGFDADSNVMWDWERAPQIIAAVENTSKQVEIIVTKKQYRNGKYLKNTVEEIINRMT